MVTHKEGRSSFFSSRGPVADDAPIMHWSWTTHAQPCITWRATHASRGRPFFVIDKQSVVVVGHTNANGSTGAARVTSSHRERKEERAGGPRLRLVMQRSLARGAEPTSTPFERYEGCPAAGLDVHPKRLANDGSIHSPSQHRRNRSLNSRSAFGGAQSIKTSSSAAAAAQKHPPHAFKQHRLEALLF